VRGGGLAESVAAAIGRLGQVSVRAYQNPYTALAWPDTVDPSADWFSTPEYLSLAGTPAWDAMPEPERKRLAFCEAVNFYSLNIHGEKSLMAGLAERMYRPEMLQVSGYLHHFLDEENKHSVFFGGFCTRWPASSTATTTSRRPGTSSSAATW
jgi:hypothetical protein